MLKLFLLALQLALAGQGDPGCTAPQTIRWTCVEPPPRIHGDRFEAADLETDTDTPSFLDLGWYLTGLPPDLEDDPPDYIPVVDPPWVVVSVVTELSFAGRQVTFSTRNCTLANGDSGTLVASSSVAYYQDLLLVPSPPDGNLSVIARIGQAIAAIDVPVIGPPTYVPPSIPLKPQDQASISAQTDGSLTGCVVTATGSGIGVSSPDLAADPLLPDGTSTGFQPYTGQGQGGSDWVTLNITVDQNTAPGTSLTSSCEDVYRQRGTVTLVVQP